MDPSHRGSLLLKLGDLIEAHKEEIAALEALDNGKPYAMALNVDVATAVRLCSYYAGWPDKITGATLPVDGEWFAYTRYEPLGVVAAILPFNFPMLGAVCKMAPAVAAGNTVVIKSAEQTPLGALYLASLIAEAGFPPGVVNILSGFGPTCGAALVKHAGVNKVTFTGSTAVGKLIQREAAETMKRVTLELGGKNACIVLEDADIDAAVRIASGGNYFNSGQICVGISRVFVHESIYDEFVARAAARAAKRSLGDQWSGADQGPQVDAAQMENVLRYVDVGVREGARLVCGGKRHGDTGYYVQPTVFADVTPNMTIAREEIFGPVMAVLKFRAIEEVVAVANDSAYGLAATVVTRDINKALPIAHALETGTVWINGHGYFSPSAPYGGRKQSGLGREYGLEGLLPYLETKTVMVSLADAIKV